MPNIKNAIFSVSKTSKWQCTQQKIINFDKIIKQINQISKGVQKKANGTAIKQS